MKNFYFILLVAFICFGDVGYSQPSNDYCSGATTLTQTATCTPTTGNTVLATQTLNPILCGGFTGYSDDDVWYQFVATSTDPTITVVGESTFDAVVDLRSDACPGTNIDCSDATLSGGTETINATGLTIGLTYWIRVYSYGSSSLDQGTFTICVFGLPPAPANNNCAGAITLTQTETCIPTNGTTVGATLSIIAGSCGGTADDDVWYQFVATSTDPTITVVGTSPFDAVVDLHATSCSGTELFCADATYSGGTETINATGLTIGLTYWVRVYSFGSSSSNQGTFTICVFGLPPAPANNNCAGAITLTQTETCIPTNGTTVGATQSIPAITCSGFTGTADDDVWYKFIANSTDPTITVVGSSTLDAVLDLHSGTCSGPYVDCADATYSGGTETINTIGLAIGSTYYVRVYGFGSGTSSQGTFVICVYGAAPVTLPTITTSPANTITNTTAISGGNITSDGGASVTARGVCWGTSSNPDVLGNHTTDGTGTGIFTSNITGLTSGTLYHIRAYATNSNGTAYGNDLNFTTTGGTPTIPIVQTTGAYLITNTNATSGGDVSSDGGSSVTARGLCWAITANPDIINSHTTDGAGTGTFVSNLTGLTPGTIYHIRAYATNSTGTAYGSDLNFTTTGGTLIIPTLTTTAAYSIGSTFATSGGNITNDGGSTVIARGICWDVTVNPDLTSSHTTDGGGTGSFSSSLTGLTPNTNYHIRAYATNSIGTAYGSDLNFSTSTGVGIIPAETTAENISIYPNPTKDELNIEFELIYPENVTLTLQDYLSQQLITENYKNCSGSYKKKIDISGLAIGIYILKIQIGETVCTKKVVVVK